MDPRVEEAIQKLKDGNATAEDAKIAFEAGYQGGPKTQEYYKELGLLDTPQEEQPQEEMPKNSILDNWNPASAPWNRQEGGGTDSIDQIDQALETDRQLQEEEKQARRQQVLNNVKSFGSDLKNYAGDINNALSAWTPVGITALGGRDRSGEAAGYAAQAAQNQYNAAQNEKLRQQNMQQAMDNAIADKMAAATAESKWKQNARALGPEGGAQTVASQNEAVTPDLWKQKQLQNERRDVATQNLAEVNRNKLMAIGNETNESMTNYATNVEDSQNAYKAALANAGGKATDNKTNNNSDNAETDTETEESTEPTISTEATKPTEDNSVDTDTESTETQPAGTTSTAVSNQESEGTETVTDSMKAQQIHDRIETIYNEVENAAKSHDATRLNELANEYDQLVADFKALPKEVQQIGYKQFDPRHSELNAENVKYDYKNLIDAVNDRTL